VVVGVVGAHHLPVSTDAYDEEPETEPPEPETGHVREEAEDEASAGVGHVAVGHYFWKDVVSEVYDAGDCEARRTDRDELSILIRYCKRRKGM